MRTRAEGQTPAYGDPAQETVTTQVEPPPGAPPEWLDQALGRGREPLRPPAPDQPVYRPRPGEPPQRPLPVDPGPGEPAPEEVKFRPVPS